MQFGDPVKPDNVKGGFGFKDNGVEEKNLYFYHPDHLGSSSYITDRVGKVTQHTEYIAFGEVLFDEHTTEFNMPYLFNGKELDQETGLYYYGARYYDPRVSIFLNVDPLAEKYPFTSPYTYTNNNPVMLIDPTGMESEETNKPNDWIKKNGKWIYRSDVTTVDQARALGAESFAKNGSVISNASIDGGDVGYVRLNQDGKAEYMPNNIVTMLVNFSNETLGGSVTYIDYEEFYNFYTDGPGRKYGAIGQETLKTGDRIKQVNFDEFIKPSAGGSSDMIESRLTKFNKFFGNIANFFNNTSNAYQLVKKPTDTFMIYKTNYTGVGYYKDGNRVTGIYMEGNDYIKTGLTKQHRDSLLNILREDSIRVRKEFENATKKYSK